MLVLIFIIVGCAIGFFIHCRDWGFESMAFLSAIIGGLLGSLIGLVLSLFIGAGAATETVLVDEYNIYALADNSQYEGYVFGNAFLVTGQGKEDKMYQFMYIEEGKGYAFGEAKASNSYLNYLADDDTAPSVQIYQEQYKSDFVKWLTGFDYFIDEYEYIFWLPPDAEIIDSFIVDFE